MGTFDIIKQIICTQMNLQPDRVWAYNSNVDLPKDQNLFIILYYGEKNPISNTIKYVETADGVEEHQAVNFCDEVIISLLSQNTQARDSVPDVLIALNSDTSRSLQMKEHVHISILGKVDDMSFFEATSMINRFDIKIKVFTSYSKIKSVDYYDKYQFETWTNLQDGQVIKEKTGTSESEVTDQSN